MLAALLLNLGGQQPQPPVRPRFGGGPFYRRYGYDESYNEIRESTTAALEIHAIPVPAYVPPLFVVQKFSIDEQKLTRAVREAFVFQDDDEEDELMHIFLLMQ